MQILSHRGLWNDTSERNTAEAFRRSFENGFGTETDLRDRNGRIVVSHDPPDDQAIEFESLLDLHASVDCSLPLALNIKEDGLQNLLSEALALRNIPSFFVFDMAVPDMLAYLEVGIPVYARQSEFEREPVCLERSTGIWLDSFIDDWFQEADIRAHLEVARPVCIVSPELHGRPYIPLWTRLLDWGVSEKEKAMLCTDYPTEAAHFFMVKG